MEQNFPVRPLSEAHRFEGGRMRAGWALGFVFVVGACRPPGPTRDVLPLRSARLYETGVAYFERSGVVSASTLPVPSGHLDDALKTLVVLSQDPRGAVAGITFQSQVSPGMARALAGLPNEGDKTLSYRALLTSLKGAAVELTLKQRPALHGRLMEVLGDARPGSNPDAQTLVLLVLGDDGKIARLDSAEIIEVLPRDPAVRARLAGAIDALGVRGAQSKRDLAVLGRVSGPLTIGYVAESPVWRASYRLVLGERASALQGWALVHNDTDEDWREVRIHLVNGRPDSFLFPLAAPRYLRRELVTPEQELATVPQLLGTTVDEMWNDEGGEESFGAGGLGLSGHGSGGGGVGTASFASPHAMAGVADSSEVTVGNLAGIDRAQGVESGALFDYELGAPLSLRAHQSGLVPFMQETLTARPITIAGDGEDARAGARLVNESRQTLPEGPLACFFAGSFAGEASLKRMKPGEVQFVTYGKDLDVAVTRTPGREQSLPQAITLVRRELVELHSLHKRELALAIENRTGQARSVYVRLDVGSNSTVAGADSVDFDRESETAIAVFEVKARSLRHETLELAEGKALRMPLASLTPKQLDQLAAVDKLTPAQRQALAAARAIVRKNDDEAAELKKAERELAEKEKDIERLRKHLGALPAGGSAARGSPFVARIEKAEDEVERLQARSRQLERSREGWTEQLAVTLASFAR
jgi:hypothetical protein